MKFIIFYVKIIFNNIYCCCFYRHTHTNVISAALRAVGNIVTGDDVQTQVIINCGALPCILHVLGSSKELVRKEACWTVSNIAAGNREQIQAVIDAHIFPVLIHILGTSEFKTKKEAAWAVTNATSGGTPEQIKYLVSLVFLRKIKIGDFFYLLLIFFLNRLK